MWCMGISRGEHTDAGGYRTVNIEYLKPSDTKETCIRKGQASYYDVEVDGEIIKDGAWSVLPLPVSCTFADSGSARCIGHI